MFLELELQRLTVSLERKQKEERKKRTIKSRVHPFSFSFLGFQYLFSSKVKTEEQNKIAQEFGGRLEKTIEKKEESQGKEQFFYLLILKNKERKLQV